MIAHQATIQRFAPKKRRNVIERGTNPDFDPG